MTIEKLLERLDKYEDNKIIKGVDLSDYGSERGMYYRCYVGLNKECECTVGELTDLIKNKIVGHTFEGYKGGEYNMDLNTPILLSSYGSVGEHIVDIKDCGEFIEFYSISAWEID